MKHYHNVPPTENYLNKIKLILSERPEIEQIFLATDDSTVIKYFKENLNIPIICYESMFRADEQNPHLHPYDRFTSQREQHKYKLVFLLHIEHFFILNSKHHVQQSKHVQQ
jgi:hypothetical protein